MIHVAQFAMSIYMRVVGFIRYAFGTSELSVRECPRCGALVLDTKTHEQWHDKLNELLQRNGDVTCA